VNSIPIFAVGSLGPKWSNFVKPIKNKLLIYLRQVGMRFDSHIDIEDPDSPIDSNVQGVGSRPWEMLA
jgi:hypothetical protein